jgi:hypothetical protein
MCADIWLDKTQQNQALFYMPANYDWQARANRLQVRETKRYVALERQSFSENGSGETF